MTLKGLSNIYQLGRHGHLNSVFDLGVYFLKVSVGLIPMYQSISMGRWKEVVATLC